MTEKQRTTIDVVGPADYARLCLDRLLAGHRADVAPEHLLYALRAACFVTLKKRGELRGCVGTLAPVEISLGREIARNAASSAFSDPRFSPVMAEEFEALEFSVDVLSPSEACLFEDLDPLRYGVIVKSGGRRGVLLPDLQGVETAEAQVRIAQQKAGIRRGEYCDLERFRVTRCRQGDSAEAVFVKIKDGERQAAFRDEVDG
jgi:AmmeMemoRadiSam system protein A